MLCIRTRQIPITVKFAIAALLCTGLLVGLSPAPAAGAADIKVTVDGQAIVFPDQQPYADANQRVLVPIRFPMEAMGVLPEWLPSTGQARLTRGGTTAIFTLASSLYTVNGVSKTMDTVPIAMNNRTLFPIRFAAEAFGATVTWDGPARSVLITTGSTGPAEDVPQPSIYIYPEDGEKLGGYTFMKITPGLEGNAIKVKCTNVDFLNVGVIRDLNNHLTGSYRRDERWMSYWDLAATAMYGENGTDQVPTGSTLIFEIWIHWYDDNLIKHEDLVYEDYQYVVPDHPKN